LDMSNLYLVDNVRVHSPRGYNHTNEAEPQRHLQDMENPKAGVQHVMPVSEHFTIMEENEVDTLPPASAEQSSQQSLHSHQQCHQSQRNTEPLQTSFILPPTITEGPYLHFPLQPEANDTTTVTTTTSTKTNTSTTNIPTTQSATSHADHHSHRGIQTGWRSRSRFNSLDIDVDFRPEQEADSFALRSRRNSWLGLDSVFQNYSPLVKPLVRARRNSFSAFQFGTPEAASFNNNSPGITELTI